MSTTIITNFNRPIIGFNLDYNNDKVLVVVEDDKVMIEIQDSKMGWTPLIGANNRGEFVACQKVWPYDKKSEVKSRKDYSIINLTSELLLKRRTFEETYMIAKKNHISSLSNTTFMADYVTMNGDILEIVSGQGFKTINQPKYHVVTNFSPYKMNSEIHPDMGWDRYNKANYMLDKVKDTFEVEDCFKILRTVENKENPTRVSMVFDVNDNTVYWVEKKNWEDVRSKKMKKYSLYY